MKKALIFLLTVAMLFAAAVPAFAVDSPTAKAPAEDIEGVAFVSLAKQSAAQKKVFLAAKECLEEAVPEGYACRFFSYLQLDDDTVNEIELIMTGTEAAEEEDANTPIEVIEDSSRAVFELDLSLDGVTDVIVKQFADGEWTQNEVEVGENSVVVKNVVDGPLAVFMK